MADESEYGTLGLKEGEVRLSEYCADWPGVYLREEKRIEQGLHDLNYALEHVGSTAVPGMLSKPIIDIAAGVSTFEGLQEFVSQLNSLGYEYRGECGVPDRHFFLFRSSGQTIFHLHLVRTEDEQWANFFLFRDFLRSNSEAAELYSRQKQELQKEYSGKRKDYTAGKDPVIRQILDQAKASGDILQGGGREQQ